MSITVDLLDADGQAQPVKFPPLRPSVFRIVWCDRCADLDDPCGCGGDYEVQVRGDLTVEPSVCPCCGEEQA